MRQTSVPEKEPATQVVKNIRRATRRHFSAEDKIRIVLEGLRGEVKIQIDHRERAAIVYIRQSTVQIERTGVDAAAIWCALCGQGQPN